MKKRLLRKCLSFFVLSLIMDLARYHYLNVDHWVLESIANSIAHAPIATVLYYVGYKDSYEDTKSDTNEEQ